MAGNNNVVRGTLIGTSAAGIVALPNSGGIEISGRSGPASGNTIGGAIAGARNIISGNLGVGITMPTGVYGTVIQGNFIGTDITGTVRLGNNGNGIGI